MDFHRSRRAVAAALALALLSLTRPAVAHEAEGDGDCYFDNHDSRNGDFDRDGDVDGCDLGVILTRWGKTGPATEDIDGDRIVGAGDLHLLMERWSPVTHSGAARPAWATVLDWLPNPAVVTNAAARAAISATELPWRVRDTATQIEMLLVPPGSFMMGCSPSSSYECDSDESPAHQVSITRAFYIGRYEVTQAQWSKGGGGIASNPSQFSGDADSPSRPVERVSWTMAQWFNSATGMRLPTEAEWEYSYRSGTTTAYHGSSAMAHGTNDGRMLSSIAWFQHSAEFRTHAVGHKSANALGIHDMAGNVWEWCSDWDAEFSAANQTDPTGPTSGHYRVLRGGGWNDSSYYCRASMRYSSAPDYTGYSVGFRVARNP